MPLFSFGDTISTMTQYKNILPIDSDDEATVSALLERKLRTLVVRKLVRSEGKEEQ